MPAAIWHRSHGETALSHAEVQANLGIKQNGKWDILRIPSILGLVRAKASGNQLRLSVSALFATIRN